MARTLKTLIQASGNSGASGQSFLNHVAGAASGAKMSDYILDVWNFTGDVPQSDVLITSAYYDFVMGIDFTPQGSRASYIKRLGAVVTKSDVSVPAGASVTITTNNIVGAATGSTHTAHVVAPYSPSASASVNSGYFRDYSYPDVPPDSGTYAWRMYHVLTGAGASGFQHVQWYAQYLPDLAGFNPLLPTKDFDAKMNNRAEVIADWEFQWYSDSGYTTLVAETYDHIVMSDPATTYYRWTKARRIGAGSWTNLGICSFTDPRVII